MTAIGSGQPDPLEALSKLNPTIPQSAVQAVHKAMSLNANERFATIEQFWQVFAAQEGWQPLRSLASAPIVDMSPSSPGKARKEPTARSEWAEKVESTPDTPLPPVITPRNRPKPNRTKRLLLLLLPILTTAYDYRYTLPAFAPLFAVSTISAWGLWLRIQARRAAGGGNHLGDRRFSPAARVPKNS